jgi:micrococcal nuclease
MKLHLTAALPVALLPMLLVTSSSTALAQVVGQVVGVEEDTIQVASGGKTLIVRLACVDAPEIAQGRFGLGPAETQRLKQLLPFGQVVTLRIVDTDQ